MGTSCPIPPRAKAWIERSMLELAHALGLERLLEATVVRPNATFFPEVFAVPLDIGAVVTRVCGYLQVDATAIDYEIVDHPVDYTRPDWGDTDVDRPTLLIPESRHPLLFVAVAAHAAARHLLAEHDLDSADGGGAEGLADLATVFCGMGVPAANSVVWDTNSSSRQRWRVTRERKLSVDQFAYALALFAWVREEVDPSWSASIRDDVREPMLEAITYLRDTGDSAFDVHTAAASAERPWARLLDHVAGDRDSLRIIALQELATRAASDAEIARAIPVVASCLDHPHPDVRGTAAMTLGAMGARATGASGRVIDLLDDDDDAVKSCAMAALPALEPEPARAIARLEELVRRGSGDLPGLAASSLLRILAANRAIDPELAADAFAVATRDDVDPNAVASALLELVLDDRAALAQAALAALVTVCRDDDTFLIDRLELLVLAIATEDTRSVQALCLLMNAVDPDPDLLEQGALAAGPELAPRLLEALGRSDLPP